MADEVTVIILTLNEARHITDCIASARSVSDHILVFDSGSTDDTVALARAAGAEVRFRAFDNYPNQRNAALAEVTTRWAFFLDADERVTPQLAEEIQGAIKQHEIAGWWIPRRNRIVGKWIRGGGWYPDHQLRLMQPDKARYDPSRDVHEVVLLDGPAGYLRSPLEHYNYDTWGEFIAKQRRYAQLEARMLARQGVRPHWYTPMTMPVREFWRRYVTLRGYQDGLHGLLLALLMGWYTGRVYRTLRRERVEA